ncbi:aminoglycoside phosphotransferase [Metarhizium guizhouense ARSEF 977]|uniref:Aminoglycoside phosphotransferase n=1 Tax=Metarhizium guizhouense (strain ARSEF 977) TaxID=1276136 RepID=A0A0B4H344_METGA|nr:aminoglycoside phosphotransferase [Metarhizium guizhouense ARSEF 977]
MDTASPKLTWKTFERRVAIYDDKVVKSESKERLQNEAATLEFISKNTSIPVPKCRLYSKDGLLHLETQFIDGVELDEIDEASRPTAIAAVHDQLTRTILPQLQALRRNYIGSVDPTIPVVPPQRVYLLDRRPWERVTSDTDCFVLCHNDLGPQNILICPSSFQIVGIIDWEYAGYYPSYFEIPLWKAVGRKEKEEVYYEAEARELAFFGLKREDLKTCR